MSFRNKDPYEFLDRAHNETIQLLFHPMHFSEEESGYLNKFRSHLKDYIDQVEDVFKVNNSVRKELGLNSLAKKLNYKE
jgi:hypothetical protein